MMKLPNMGVEHFSRFNNPMMKCTRPSNFYNIELIKNMFPD